MQVGHLGRHGLYYGEFTLLAAMVAVLIAHMLSGRGRIAVTILEFGPLVWIGRISYSLYLVHGPIMVSCMAAGLGWRHPVNTLLVAGLSFAAAIVSHYAVERPCLRLKHRFEPSRAEPDVQAPALPMKAAA
jgi:peptidoglycan/LPS O-acetylase OafA/YrhL